MSDGIRIFEKATRELLNMHNAGCLMELGKVSDEYSCVEREFDKVQQDLAAALPKEAKEACEKLNKLYGYFKAQEAITGEIFYKQGVADGISLVMQSLMWESSRR